MCVVDSPLFAGSPDGKRRAGAIIGITGSIRFYNAVHKACEHNDGGPEMGICLRAYMQRFHRTYMDSMFELPMYVRPMVPA